MILVCIIWEWCERDDNWRIIDIHYEKPDPYRDFENNIGTTGLCRNKSKISPQSKTYVAKKELWIDEIYYLYYNTSKTRTKVINKNEINFVWLLKVTEVYKNHSEIKEIYEYPNIMKNRRWHYWKCYDYPYIIWSWDKIIPYEWIKINLLKIKKNKKYKNLSNRKAFVSYLKDELWEKLVINDIIFWREEQWQWIWWSFNNKKEFYNFIKSIT